LLKAKVIPINWKRIDEKTYQYDNMEISSVGDIETGIPFEVRNMMIKIRTTVFLFGGNMLILRPCFILV